MIILYNMGNRQVNIKAMNKCITVDNNIVENGTPVVTSDCTNDKNQLFTYDTDTHQIKFLDKCLNPMSANLASGTLINLWDCNDLRSQQWYINQNGISNGADPNKCLAVQNSSIQNGVPLVIDNCNNQMNQLFMLVDPNRLFSKNPLIVRNNMIIPDGSLPNVQLSTLSPYHVLLSNENNKNILISPGTKLTSSSSEIICLGRISRFILAPLSALTMIYYHQGQTKEILFSNITPDHDLIYDINTSFTTTLQNELTNITSYYINSAMINYKINGVIKINNIISPGVFLISLYNNNTINFGPNDVDLNNFSPTVVNSTSSPAIVNIDIDDVKDYIVGPYTLINLGSISLYNSSSSPLLYKNLSGIKFSLTNIIIYPAAPLNSGYVNFFNDCKTSSMSVPALVGKYNIYNNIGTASIQNNGWNQSVYYSDANSENPLIIFGNKNINGLIVGPYTKVTLYKNSNFQGAMKILENNTTTEKNFNLCLENFAYVTSSIIIEFSSSYVGFGIITQKMILYAPNTDGITCQPPAPKSVKMDYIKNTQVASPYPSNIVKKSNIINNLNVSNLTKLGMNCNNNPLVSFGLTYTNLKADPEFIESKHPLQNITSINTPTKYYQTYSCDPKINYSNAIPYKQTVIINNFDDLHAVNIDCGSRAILAVNATANGNVYTYNYLCGDKVLNNITSYQSQPISIKSKDLSPLLNVSINCNNGQLLSYKLNVAIEPTGTASYYYNYKCSKNIPYSELNLETFDNIEKYSNIIFNDNNVEYHLICPIGYYQNINFPKGKIKIYGNGVMVDLKSNKKIDTFKCINNEVHNINNKFYSGIGIRQIKICNTQKIYLLTIFAIIIVFIIVCIVYRNKN